jgi:hypothetical protein
MAVLRSERASGIDMAVLRSERASGIDMAAGNSNMHGNFVP